MPEQAAPYRWDGRDLVLRVRVQPRAASDELAGVVGSRLRLRVTSPPVDGKANSHVVRFLAELFRVARSHVEIETGLAGREKTVRIREPRRVPEPIDSPPAADV